MVSAAAACRCRMQSLQGKRDAGVGCSHCEKGKRKRAKGKGKGQRAKGKGQRAKGKRGWLEHAACHLSPTARLWHPAVLPPLHAVLDFPVSRGILDAVPWSLKARQHVTQKASGAPT